MQIKWQINCLLVRGTEIRPRVYREATSAHSFGAFCHWMGS
jgi:hypothetical protein